MSIDEVMQIAAEYREASTYSEKCVARIILRTAIEQRVAEEVEREREECAKVCDDIRAHRPTTGAGGLIAEECATAIRARAEKETT
jgi:Ribonuclease G/E